MSERDRAKPGQRLPTPGRRAQATARPALDIHALDEGEALVDDATFSEMEARLANAHEEGGVDRFSPHPPETGELGEDELLLVEILSGPPAREAGEHAEGATPPTVPPATPAEAAAPATDVDTELLRAMGRSQARDRLVVPVSIRGRVVNLLYADDGPDPLAETSVAALTALGSCVARAYERLILERKRSGS